MTDHITNEQIRELKAAAERMVLLYEADNDAEAEDWAAHDLGKLAPLILALIKRLESSEGNLRIAVEVLDRELKAAKARAGLD